MQDPYYFRHRLDRAIVASMIAVVGLFVLALVVYFLQ
jgi:hypothetical protein